MKLFLATFAIMIVAQFFLVNEIILAECLPDGTGCPPITNIGQVQTSLEKIVVWLYGVFWILAVGFVIWAAFLFMNANGEADKITKAKTMLVYTLIAAAVVLLANGIRDIVTNLLEGKI